MNDDPRQSTDQRSEDTSQAGAESRESRVAAVRAGESVDSDELAAPLEDAPPVPRDDPELGIDGVGAGELP